MSETLSERDIRVMLDVIDAGRHGEPTEGIPWEVLHKLTELIPCEAISFNEYDALARRNHVLLWLEQGEEEAQIGDDGQGPPEFWEAGERFEPCTYPNRTGDFATAVRWSDFYSDRQLRNLAWGRDFIVEFAHGMHASMPTTMPGHRRKISIWRAKGPDFSERDRLAAELIRPHLWEIYQEGQRRRRPRPTLSPREWEVLRLVYQGFDNAEIARQLFVATSTVRKHLEHVFDRTGIRNRTAVAALMVPGKGA